MYLKLLIFPALFLFFIACNRYSDKIFIADWEYDSSNNELDFSKNWNPNSKVLALGFETYLDSFVKYKNGLCSVNNNLLSEEDVELFENL